VLQAHAPCKQPDTRPSSVVSGPGYRESSEELSTTHHERYGGSSARGRGTRRRSVLSNGRFGSDRVASRACSHDRRASYRASLRSWFDACVLFRVVMGRPPCDVAFPVPHVGNATQRSRFPRSPRNSRDITLCGQGHREPSVGKPTEARQCAAIPGCWGAEGRVLPVGAG
jgi:hypothetical protein